MYESPYKYVNGQQIEPFITLAISKADISQGICYLNFPLNILMGTRCKAAIEGVKERERERERGDFVKDLCQGLLSPSP